MDADDDGMQVAESPSGCLWLDLVSPFQRMLGPGPSHRELLLSSVGAWLVLGGAADVLGIIVTGGQPGALWPVPGFGLCAELSGFSGVSANALGIALGGLALASPPARRWRTNLRASVDRLPMLTQCAALVVLLWMVTSMLCVTMAWRALYKALSGS